MEIIGIKKVDDFRRNQSGLRNVVDGWRVTTEGALWKNYEEMKQTFPSADYNSLHGAYIFDLGKKYRLLVNVQFVAETVPLGRVSILDIMHHDDYDKWSHTK